MPENERAGGCRHIHDEDEHYRVASREAHDLLRINRRSATTAWIPAW